MIKEGEISFKEMTMDDLKKIEISNINDLLKQLTEREYSFSIEQFKSIIAKDDIVQFFAYPIDSDFKVVGLLTLVIFFTPTGSHAQIEDVVVDRHYRGNHIGHIIMDMALAKAKKLNIKKIDLTSSPRRKAANALYLKMGFEKRNTNAYRYTIT